MQKRYSDITSIIAIAVISIFIPNSYKQDKFTDTYSEYFEDDENKADRFTDDYEIFTD